MNWSKWIRQFHRWMSVAFTLVVAAIFAAQGMGRELAQWVYFLPLAPLAPAWFLRPMRVRKCSPGEAGSSGGRLSETETE